VTCPISRVCDAFVNRVRDSLVAHFTGDNTGTFNFDVGNVVAEMGDSEGGSASGNAAVLIQHTMQQAALRYTDLHVCMHIYIHVYLHIRQIGRERVWDAVVQHTMQQDALRYTYMCVYIYVYIHVYLYIQHYIRRERVWECCGAYSVECSRLHSGIHVCACTYICINRQI